jgi:hypothetical protein
MSRREKDEILDRVLAEVAPRPRWPRRAALGAFALAAAAAGVLVLRPGAPRDEFAARGGELSPGFEVTCVPAPCAIGSKLVFDITSRGGAAYFAAFARRGDTLIWYFPSTSNARSRPLPPGGGVLDTGIVIGAEHAPGSYEIDGVFSPVPLDRAEIRARVEHGGATVRQVTIR